MAYRAVNLAKAREYRLRTKYGLTQAQKDELLLQQNSRCATCGTDTPGTNGWQTDHKHGTSIVRGILCRSCNLALGNVKDNPDTLRNMIDYLQRQECSIA